MQTLQLTNGQEYLLSDEEAEKLKSNLDKKLIQLSNGDVINTFIIARIGSLDRIKSWGGHVLKKDGKSFIRDGDIIYLEAHNFNEVEEIEDPKYKSMQIINIKQLK